MESITIKVNDAMAKEIEKAMKPDYSTKTEFIRDALREKLNKIRQTKEYKELRKYLGILKTKTTDEELHKIREKVVNRMFKERGLE
jgi:metal-responsive CopG/Arc/MetJ family transcriptional regulator